MENVSLKTEYSYCEEDFIETDGKMNELCVTISIREYKRLIENNVRHCMYIDSLENENKTLRIEIEQLRNIVVKNVNPEFFEKIKDLYDLLLGQKGCEEND